MKFVKVLLIALLVYLGSLSCGLVVNAMLTDNWDLDKMNPFIVLGIVIVSLAIQMIITWRVTKRIYKE